MYTVVSEALDTQLRIGKLSHNKVQVGTGQSVQLISQSQSRICYTKNKGFCKGKLNYTWPPVSWRDLVPFQAFVFWRNNIWHCTSKKAELNRILALNSFSIDMVVYKITCWPHHSFYQCEFNFIWIQLDLHLALSNPRVQLFLSKSFPHLSSSQSAPL